VRRRFLGGLAAAAAAPALALRASAASGTAPARLPICFSTLGCPDWDWDRILREAERLGYAAVELRGLRGDLDLPARPEFRGARLHASRSQLTGRGLEVVALGASAELHDPDERKRAAHLDEGRRFVDLAEALRARYVRVFGDELVPGEARAATVERIARGLRALAAHARGSGVTILLESHGDFVRAPALLEVLRAVDLPQVGLLWDAHHTFVAGHEPPADTFRALGPLVRHVHLKDSRGGAEYVLTGEGTVPVRDTVRVLAAGGYAGVYSFEWEKTWHPEIAAPEVAFPHYARVMGGYLAHAGAET
jgi:sugar phosphate isomerase/epimerase